MFNIQLIETGHAGLISALKEDEIAGTLSFRLNGPLKLVVDELDIRTRLTLKSVAWELLDILHQYAHENGYRIYFQCPKAKSLNDQQIAHELRQLAHSRAAAA